MVYRPLQDVLVNAARDSNYSTDFDFVTSFYGTDFDCQRLKTQIELSENFVIRSMYTYQTTTSDACY